MAIDSKIPEISVLRSRVEATLGAPLSVHSDFEVLRDAIFSKTKEHLSESTLERLWNYSTRKYDTVSRHTLDVLSRYAGEAGWDAFLISLKKENMSESDIFDSESIVSADLNPGDRLRIGWQPDRVCTLRYLGGSRWTAEETRNSKLQPGDTFSCLGFQLHSPVYFEDLTATDGSKLGRYGAGLKHGLTMLQKLDP